MSTNRAASKQSCTQVTGPVAEVAGLSGGWALAACQNNTVPEFASQSFQFSHLAILCQYGHC